MVKFINMKVEQNMYIYIYVYFLSIGVHSNAKPQSLRSKILGVGQKLQVDNTTQL